MVLKQQLSTNTGTCVAELPFIYLSTHDSPPHDPLQDDDKPKCAEMPNLGDSILTEFTKLVAGHRDRVRV